VSWDGKVVQDLERVSRVDLSSLSGIVKRLRVLEDGRRGYRGYFNDMEFHSGEVETAQGSLCKLVEEYDQLVDGMDICPVTGNALPAECKKALKGVDSE
jgi:hypothetical protein